MRVLSQPLIQASSCMNFSQLEPPIWVAETLDRCHSVYLNSKGLLITAIDSNGAILDAEPLIADFGDILPFLWFFGLQDFVRDQLDRARPYLLEGLYRQRDRVHLFYNHDWLLGLLDLHRQSGDLELLDLAETGAATVGQSYFYRDLLIDEHPRLLHPRSWLMSASPFNGGYIELWVDLYKRTGKTSYLEWASRLACGWVRDQTFRDCGVFPRRFSTWIPCAESLFCHFVTLRSRLFKDNTNLVWGILSLYQETGNAGWRDVLTRWVDGFERYFWNHGNVYLMLDYQLNGYGLSLKAGFSALDLLCDLNIAGVDPDRTQYLGASIGDFWLDQQWENGLFPEEPGGGWDHLDANLDLVVALSKLCAITGNPRYADAAGRCKEALLALHAMPTGYCLSVGRDGTVRDSRVIVKYQGLLLKLAILPNKLQGIFTEPDRIELLRDR